jgi:mannose-1-phosphate guanylyltransferase/mannose-6-phosphate isomerase
MMIHEKTKVIFIVLAGGTGKRLWPISRSFYPKQFLNFFDNFSLFQNSIKRIKEFTSRPSKYFEYSDTFILTNEDFRFIIQDQLTQIDFSSKVILEPESKNTAPSLALAAFLAQEIQKDSVLIVVSSDHLIKEDEPFYSALNEAIKIAINNNIVLLGVPPKDANTAFGYINANKLPSNKSYCDIKGFYEKPSLENAMEYIKNKNFFWNSGIFVLKASVWLDALKFFCNDIYEKTSLSFKHKKIDGFFLRPEKKYFNEIIPVSIDNAVIEKCINSAFTLKMVPLHSNWNDLGSFDSLWSSSINSADGCAIDGDVVNHNCKNSLMISKKRLIAAVGIENLAIIETPDVMLVANLNYSQEIKKLVESLSSQERVETEYHTKVSRPWGFYEILGKETNFQIKKIKVNPHSSLSLQRHKYRAEHWTVISGEAKIICDNKVMILKSNESTFIPAGSMHRIENIKNEFLEIIEVATGSYFGEDDIERFEDNYGREMK